MSGGMAQRALFATALLGHAALIVADEPTKGLDDRRAAQRLDALMRLRKDGRRLLAITHDLDLARELGGRVLVMQAGRVIEAGAAEALFGAPRDPYTRALPAADPRHWPPRRRAPPAGPAVAEIRDLSFAYGKRRVIENLSLRIHAGEILALTGDGGTGQTTLGNLLPGLHRPRSGGVLWTGPDTGTDRRARARLRRRFQKLHQDPAAILAPHRSIARHFDDFADFMPATGPRERLHALLARMRLRPGLLARSVAAISGGEAQRLALARILLLDPMPIVADEPSSRLDPIIQRGIFELPEAVRAAGSTAIVLISHRRTLVRFVAHRVLHLGPAGSRETARPAAVEADPPGAGQLQAAAAQAARMTEASLPRDGPARHVVEHRDLPHRARDRGDRRPPRPAGAARRGRAGLRPGRGCNPRGADGGTATAPACAASLSRIEAPPATPPRRWDRKALHRSPRRGPHRRDPGSPGLPRPPDRAKPADKGDPAALACGGRTRGAMTRVRCNTGIASANLKDIAR